MSDRLRVQKALTEVLEEITIENGYNFDLSQSDGREKVFRGRNIFGEDDPDVVLSILEPPIPLEAFFNYARDNVHMHSNWELLIQGFVRDDGEEAHPTDQGHVLMQDVKDRLKKEMKRSIPGSHGDMNILGLGPLVIKLTLGQGVVRPPDETSARTFFWLLVTLQLAEK